MKRFFLALLVILAPLAHAAPAEEIARRFVEPLWRDDFALLAKVVDPRPSDSRAWEQYRGVLDRYDCITIERYDWSVVSQSADRVAIRLTLEGSGALKALSRPRRRLAHIWHIEAELIRGSWYVTSAITEERRVAIQMLAATPHEAERLLGEVRDADVALVVAKYAREIAAKNDLPRFEHAVALARSLGDVTAQVDVLTEHAEGFHVSDPPRMLEIAREAEQLARRAGTADNLADAMLMLGLARLTNGDRDGARESYAEGAALVDVVDDPVVPIMCLAMYSWTAMGRGSPVDTLRNAERFNELTQRYGWEEGEQQAIFNHAEVHWQLGNLDVVRADNEELIRLGKAQENRRTAAYAMLNLAMLELREERLAQAVRDFREAIAFLPDEEPLVITSLREMSGALIELRRLDEAEEAIRKFEAFKDEPPEVQSGMIFLRSELHLARGQTEQAIAAARESMRTFDASIAQGDFGARVRIQRGLIRALRGGGRTEEMIAELRQAIEAIERRQEEIGADPLGRLAFLQEYVGMYGQLVEALVDRGETGEAFRVAEQMKGRGLREAIAESHIDLSASMSDEERAREEALQGKINEVNRTLLESRKKDPALEQQLAVARRELDAFRSETRIKHPLVGRRRGEAVAALTLPEGSESLALVEYVVAESRVIAFVLTDRAPMRVVNIPVKRAALERDVRELESLTAARSPGYARLARRLHKTLFAPVERYVRGSRTLALVPDGMLWAVPFQALVAEDGSDLLDRYAVFYTQSLSLLRSASTMHSESPARLLAFGNPSFASDTKSAVRAVFRGPALGSLIDAETEVRSVAAMYPRRLVRYRDAASEIAFKSEAPAYNVIHIAAHALIDDRAPMYSAIVLNGKGTDDGLLEAREVVDLPLRADLAILSACRTARGKISSGEGVIGLSWAFFAAGCPTTVVSQWNAESAATAKLMIEFHRRLRAGESAAAALRHAQLSVRKIAKYRHPFYWAPFVAVGAAQR